MRRPVLLSAVLLALLATVLGLPDRPAQAAPNGEAYTLTEVVGGLDGPVTLQSPPGDDRRFVVQQSGVVLLLDEQGRTSTFLDIRDLTERSGEQGLLGLAFSPTFAEDGRFWVNHTDLGGDTVVARYEVAAGDPDVADPSTRTIVLEVDQPFSNHNGGMLAFAHDGMLLVGLGDGGGAGDPTETGQDASDLLGSILRLDVVERAGSGYRVPSDNPFVGDARADEVWAYGLRNPWRFTVDRLTGDVWIGDVGQNEVEEVDRLDYTPSRAANLGWDRWEGTSCFEGPCTREGLTFPVTEYTHSEGCSITGGYVSRAASTPSLYGTYLYSDFCSGFVRAYDPATGRDTDLDVPNVGNVIGFGQDAAGELYVLTTTSVFALRGEGSGTRFSDVPAGGTFAADVVALAEAGVTEGCEPRVPHRYCPADPVTRAQMAGFLADAAGLPDADEPFTDVPDDGVFAGPIGAVAAEGITQGCNQAGTRYCPSRSITRQELAAFLTRALDLQPAPEDFDDVPDDSPFAGAIGAVVEAGIAQGCDVDRFCPTGTVTRAQMAAFLVDAYGL